MHSLFFIVAIKTTVIRNVTGTETIQYVRCDLFSGRFRYGERAAPCPVPKVGTRGKGKGIYGPEKALEDLRHILWKDEPLLILLDIGMLGLSGYEFLECMVREGFPPGIDVVVVTSSISNGDMALAKKFPQFVRGFVLKPLSLGQLKGVMEQTFGLKRWNDP